MIELLRWFGQNALAALLMIPCVMLACRAFRDRRAVQHLLWLVILLKLVTPPVVVWPWSVDELRSMAWSQESNVQVATLEPSAVSVASSRRELWRLEATDTFPNELVPNLKGTEGPRGDRGGPRGTEGDRGGPRGTEGDRGDTALCRRPCSLRK